MQIKELWLNLMDTYTMKVFATLIVLDIFSLVYIIYLFIYFLDKSGSEFLIFSVLYSIPYFTVIKILVPTIVYLFERKYTKQQKKYKERNKFYLVIETISVLTQLLILVPVTILSLELLYNNYIK